MRTIPIAALLLVGCASQPIAWVKPGGTAEQVALDDADCDYRAAAATANYGSDAPTARSYGGAIGQGFGAGLGRAIEERKLSTMCMRAKGYYPQQQQVDYGTTSRPDTPSKPVTTPTPAGISPQVAIARLDDLRSYVTTIEAAKKLFGPPTSENAMADGTTFLQWIYQDGPKLAHIGIVFGHTGVMTRLATRTQIGF